MQNCEAKAPWETRQNETKFLQKTKYFLRNISYWYWPFLTLNLTLQYKGNPRQVSPNNPGVFKYFPLSTSSLQMPSVSPSTVSWGSKETQEPAYGQIPLEFSYRLSWKSYEGWRVWKDKLTRLVLGLPSDFPLGSGHVLIVKRTCTHTKRNLPFRIWCVYEFHFKGDYREKPPTLSS